MRRLTFFTLTLLLSIALSAHAVTVTLTQNFDGDKYPEGGHPQNEDHYNTFSFSLQVDGLAGNKYYDIVVDLDPTNYKGYAANFGVTTENDLKFHPDDNDGWTYVGESQLSYVYGTDANSQNVPATITSRCYDWAASGSVTVTVTPRDGGMAMTDTKCIPFDENENGIADNWPKLMDENGNVDESKFDINQNTPLANGKNGYDPTLDDEVAPDDKNKNIGDGWIIYDEYRGIFTKSTDAAVTRLDPTQKDVMYCSDSSMEDYELGNTPSINKHLYYKLTPFEIENSGWSIVNEPWGEVFNGNLLAESVSEDTGRVNFNSDFPGANPVWAIRITRGKQDDNPRNRFGQTSGGSPSRYTKIKVFVDSIERKVDEAYVKAKNAYDAQGKAQYLKYAEKAKTPGERTAYENRAKNYKWKLGTQAKIDAGKKFRINNTIAHEVLHDHNINRHCTHLTCFMKNPSGTSKHYQIDPDTGNLVIKIPGSKVKSLSLDSLHKKTLAITGHTNAGVTACNYSGISFGEITLEMLGIDTEQTTQTTTPVTTPTPSPTLVTCDIQGCTLTTPYDPNDAASAALHAYCGQCYQYKCNGTDHQLVAANSWSLYCTSHSFYACQSSNHISTGNCPSHTIYACDSLTHQEEQCTNTNANGDRCTYLFWRCVHPNVPSYGPSHIHSY